MSGLGLGCCTAPLPVPSGKIKIWLCPYPILCFVRRETGNRPTHPFSLKATLCLFFPTLDTGGQQRPGLALSFLEQGSHCSGAELLPILSPTRCNQKKKRSIAMIPFL